jgi:hypothetical protein
MVAYSKWLKIELENNKQQTIIPLRFSFSSFRYQ